MFLKFLQFCIVIAVIGSNGAYHWTPNNFLAGLLGVLAAFLVTLFLIWTRDLWSLLLHKLGYESRPRGWTIW